MNYLGQVLDLDEAAAGEYYLLSNSNFSISITLTLCQYENKYPLLCVNSLLKLPLLCDKST